MVTQRLLVGFINGIPKLEGNLRHVETKPVDYDSETKWVKSSHVYAEDLGGIEIYWKFTMDEFPNTTVPAIGDRVELHKVTKKTIVTYD